MLEEKYRIYRDSTRRAEQEIQRIDEMIEAAGGFFAYMAGPVYRSTGKEEGHGHVGDGEGSQERARGVQQTHTARPIPSPSGR